MKGRTNNPSGRPKGVPNKATTDLRQWINKFIGENLEQLKKDWKQLDAKDRVVMFEKLLKYSLPTLQATSGEIKFEDLSEEQLDKIIERLKAVGYEQEG